jgi:hypothetical protein
MKALIINSPTTTVLRSRHGLAILVTLIMVVALSLGLATVLYLREPAQAITSASSVNTYVPLDQHERHPAGFVNTYAPLDQHERHSASLVTSSAAHHTSWPRRREVWEITTDVDIYAPLDQHERHPTGLPHH